MHYPIENRLPCSVCGLDTVRRHGWFLLVENRWLDRLKILTWHPSIAAQKDIKTVCCRQHLRILIAHWLDQASLRFSPGDDLPMPIAGEPAHGDSAFTAESVGQMLGELAVHREAVSCGWTGSPAALECILDALVPVEPEIQTYTMELPPLRPRRDSFHEFALHQDAGRPAT